MIGTAQWPAVSLSGNSATYGGGIYNHASSVTISGSTLTTNVASTAGGAIYNDGSTVIVKNGSSITGNTAPVKFGADVYNQGVQLGQQQRHRHPRSAKLI